MCKACRKAANKRYMDATGNKERQAELSALRYQRNKEKISSRRKARYEQNKAATLEQNRRWREQNIDRHRALCRDWAARHPEKMRELVARRRATQLGADGSHTNKDVAMLLAAQSGLCAACHADVSTGFHVDHVIPLSKGGSDGPENLQILCPSCNRSKASKLPHELPVDFYRSAPQR